MNILPNISIQNGSLDNPASILHGQLYYLPDREDRSGFAIYFPRWWHSITKYIWKLPTVHQKRQGVLRYQIHLLGYFGRHDILKAQSIAKIDLDDKIQFAVPLTIHEIITLQMTLGNLYRLSSQGSPSRSITPERVSRINFLTGSIHEDHNPDDDND